MGVSPFILPKSFSVNTRTNALSRPSINVFDPSAWKPILILFVG